MTLGQPSPQCCSLSPFMGIQPCSTPGTASPQNQEVVPEIAGSGTMGGSQPCCWHLVLLPGRRQVRRHGNCHGEMQKGNNALDSPPTAQVSLHSWAGSRWGKAELETHGISAQPPGTLQSPVRTIKTLWVPYRATWGPYTPHRDPAHPSEDLA